MDHTTYRTPKTGQYLCMECGFQSNSLVFKTINNEGQQQILCPDCDSANVVNADSKVSVNKPEPK